MLTTMITVFLIGYLLIALEHPLKINKAGTALLTGTILWVLYTFGAPQFIPTASAEEFKLFLDAFPFIKDLPYADQCIRFVIDHQILDSIGEIAETLIFLIGAMITVELVDSHGGFMFITNRITTNSKRKLLFVIATITFFMSAVLDNLTTSIVMVMLIRKLIGVVGAVLSRGTPSVAPAGGGGGLVAHRRRDNDHAVGKGKYLDFGNDPASLFTEPRISLGPGIDHIPLFARQSYASQRF